jgi:Host cell surface-exposed lipoprotein
MKRILKRTAIGFGIFLVLMIGLGAALGSPKHTTTTRASVDKPVTATVVKATPKPTPKPKATPKPQPAPKPEMTESQKNAVNSANDYLTSQPFSKAGLVQQLSSSAGDGYPEADAEFAVNHIQVDWNEQAVKSARNYLSSQSFSRQGLIEQLSSSAGEGFTLAQAEYGVSKAYR